VGGRDTDYYAGQGRWFRYEQVTDWVGYLTVLTGVWAHVRIVASFHRKSPELES
jgi:hypothetical protein